MNIFGFLLGAAAIKQVTDYPQEIRKLKSQMPQEERAEFLRDYKKLSKNEKAQFKDCLRKADLSTAGTLVGHDLAKYKVEQPKPDEQQLNQQVESNVEDSGTDIVARINRILSVPIPEIDPALVAEAARKYENSALTDANIVDRTKKILDLSS